MCHFIHISIDFFIQSIAFEICANVPNMHDLQTQLVQLGDSSQNLIDQQCHLEALWNHLSRRLTQKERMLKNRFSDNHRTTVIANQSLEHSPEVEIIVDKWLHDTKNAVEKLVLVADLLDLSKEIDLTSLKQVFVVCFINYG